jgi:hypothetical protein
MVRDLMTGAKPLWSDKAWLYDIVANKTNGIDVDKMDYLKRDAYHTKMSLSLDVQRLMLKSKVHKDQVGTVGGRCIKVLVGMEGVHSHSATAARDAAGCLRAEGSAQPNLGEANDAALKGRRAHLCGHCIAPCRLCMKHLQNAYDLQ